MQSFTPLINHVRQLLLLDKFHIWDTKAQKCAVANQDYISNQCQSQDLNLGILASLAAQRLKHVPPMRETRVWSLGREDSLEKEMATHSSILVWRIPWMEEPGGLQSMGLQRVGHDWVTSLSLSEEKNCSHLDLCFFWDHSMSLLSSFFSSWWTGEKSECWVIWRNSVKFVFCCFFLDVCRFICCLKKTYNTS